MWEAASDWYCFFCWLLSFLLPPHPLCFCSLPFVCVGLNVNQFLLGFSFLRATNTHCLSEKHPDPDTKRRKRNHKNSWKPPLKHWDYRLHTNKAGHYTRGKMRLPGTQLHMFNICDIYCRWVTDRCKWLHYCVILWRLWTSSTRKSAKHALKKILYLYICKTCLSLNVCWTPETNNRQVGRLFWHPPTAKLAIG